MDLLTMGETLVCLAANQSGRLDHVRGFDKSFGGAESNTAIGVARLGLRAGWISRVSSDPFGDALVRTLRGEGVDVSGVVRGPEPTGLMIKEYRAPGDIHIYYWREGSAASRLQPADVDEQLLANARRVHLSGITLALGAGPAATVHHILRRCRERGTPVSFDPNLRLKLWSLDEAVQAMHEVLPWVDDLLCNESEAIELAGRDKLDEAIEALSAGGERTVVVKRGADGVAGLSGGQLCHVGAPPAQVVDTVGAGDAFNAGYLFGCLEGYSFERCLEIGAWVAAHVVAHRGDYEGAPHLRDLQAWTASAARVTR